MPETGKDWKLPKNVRQIGDGKGDRKVYVEDYVITFLEKGGLQEKTKKAVLFGEVKEKGANLYIFIDGALEVDTFYMDEAAREMLLKKIEQFFPQKRVVGWFLLSEESPVVLKKEIVDIFQKEFAGDDQVLIVRDDEEEETAVFMMEEEQPVQQPGYYIYYEKNTAMQEYLISRSAGKSVEKEAPVKDEAIKRFRKIVKAKQKLSSPQLPKVKLPSIGRLTYAAGSFLVVTVLALGVTLAYNYDKMKEVERSLAKLTDNMDSQAEYVNEGKEATQVMLHIDNQAEAATEKTTENSVETLERVISDPQQHTGDAQQNTDEPQQNAGNTQTAQDKTAQESKQQSADETAKETAQPLAQTEAQTQAGTETGSDVPASAAGRASYIVKVGDTLAGISEMYYGSLEKVEAICTLNGIDDENTILPGQKILLP